MIIQESQHYSLAEVKTDNKSCRVLFVDDEAAVCFAFSKLLENESFGFDICESIEEALPLLGRNEYFAVISDVRFSGTNNEDGLSFMSVVRREQPQSKVILVTGYGSEELKKTAHALGASHYFEKPVMPTKILSLLRALHQVADEIEEDKYFKSLTLSNIPV